MKKFVVTLVLGTLAFAVCLGSAQARPPYAKEFGAKYVEGNKDTKFTEAVAAAKCNVCHDAKSKSKKDRNEYGKALSEHLSEADFKKLKDDAEALKKKIIEALEKTEADKNAAEKTYGDLIKAGQLPGG